MNREISGGIQQYQQSPLTNIAIAEEGHAIGNFFDCQKAAGKHQVAAGAGYINVFPRITLHALIAEHALILDESQSDYACDCRIGICGER